jgi:hypothetical protein
MSGDATKAGERQAPAGPPSAAFSAEKLAAGVYCHLESRNCIPCDVS